MSIGDTVAEIHQGRGSRAEAIQLRQMARDRKLNGDFDGALDVCELLVREFPSFPDGLVMLATLLLEQPDIEARRTLSDSKTVLMRAKVLLVKALKQDSKDWNARLAICRVMIRTKEYKLAVRQCTSAQKWNPENFYIRYYLATGLRMLKKYEEAAREYEIAAEVRPTSASAHFFHGTMVQKYGDAKIAVASFRKSLALKDDDAQVHSHIGVALAEVPSVDVQAHV